MWNHITKVVFKIQTLNAIKVKNRLNIKKQKQTKGNYLTCTDFHSNWIKYNPVENSTMFVFIWM